MAIEEEEKWKIRALDFKDAENFTSKVAEIHAMQSKTCFNCGSPEHFAKNCPKVRHMQNNGKKQYNTSYDSLAKQQPQKERESKQNGLSTSIEELLKTLNTLLQSQQKYISPNSQKGFSNSQNSKYQNYSYNNSYKANKPHQDSRPQRQQY